MHTGAPISATRVLLLLIAVTATGCSGPKTGVTRRSEADSSATGPTSASKRSTKLEQFSSKSGIVIVRGYTDVGSVSGLYGGKASVLANELTEPHTHETSRGIVIDITQDENNSHQSFIDYDEIPPLLQGIDYVLSADSTSTRLKNFEASYRTIGDFVVTTFNSSVGRPRTLVSLKSGDIAGAHIFCELDQLRQFRGLVARAKETVDAASATTR